MFLYRNSSETRGGRHLGGSKKEHGSCGRRLVERRREVRVELLVGQRVSLPGVEVRFDRTDQPAGLSFELARNCLLEARSNGSGLGTSQAVGLERHFVDVPPEHEVRDEARTRSAFTIIIDGPAQAVHPVAQCGQTPVSGFLVHVCSLFQLISSVTI